MKHILFFTILSILSNKAFAEQEIKLFFEDADYYPYSMKNKTGLDLLLLDMVGKKIGVKFSYTPVPWERCLSTIQSGDVDGCFSASFKEKRMENGDYPMALGKADETKRLHTTSYSIFVRAEDVAKYKIKGLDIEGLNKDKDVIATTMGYSITDDYKKAGYKVDDGGTRTDLNMNKLLKGRVSVFAAMTEEVDFYLERPEYKGKIIKLTPPVVDKAYYLMLSKKFTSAHADTAKKIWETILEVRESKKFKEQSAAFLAK
ncbi:MAG: transporter substrate-binding domain-containing protein [Bacteriovorax sp.]|nr:transporter substrate-binding domain-containing protein [Bacteriovorax sp.]